MPTTDRKLRVFLCHSSQDKPIVRELYQRLLAEGWIDPWLDEEKLLPGQDWDMEIEKAVEAADAVIVCLSNKSVTKEGYVQKEIKVALNFALYKPEETIFIVPLRLDDCPSPRSLRSIQYIDYFPKDRKDWAYNRLIRSLKVRFNQEYSKEIKNQTQDAIDSPQKKADLSEMKPQSEKRVQSKDRSEKDGKSSNKVVQKKPVVTPVNNRRFHDKSINANKVKISDQSSEREISFFTSLRMLLGGIIGFVGCFVHFGFDQFFVSIGVSYYIQLISSGVVLGILASAFVVHRERPHSGIDGAKVGLAVSVIGGLSFYVSEAVIQIFFPYSLSNFGGMSFDGLLFVLLRDYLWLALLFLSSSLIAGSVSGYFLAERN